MILSRLGKYSAKIIFYGQEVSVIEDAFYSYRQKLSSKIIIIWLIICVQNKYGMKIGKNISIEFIKDKEYAAIYLSGYTPKYHISKLNQKRYICRIQKQLVCCFEDTDKLISFAKFIYSQGYKIKRDRLFSSGRRYILTIEGKIPFEAVGEFCQHYSIADSGEIISPDYSLICENGAIGIIAGI